MANGRVIPREEAGPLYGRPTHSSREARSWGPRATVRVAREHGRGNTRPRSRQRRRGEGPVGVGCLSFPSAASFLGLITRLLRQHQRPGAKCYRTHVSERGCSGSPRGKAPAMEYSALFYSNMFFKLSTAPLPLLKLILKSHQDVNWRNKAVLTHLNNQQDSFRPKSDFWVLIYSKKITK